MERLWFTGNLAEVLVERGDLSIIRMHAPAGEMPPLHVHAYEGESFYVLEGAMTLWVGDADPVTIGPGEIATAPPALPHTYRVGKEPAVYLVTTSRGAFASFVRAAGDPAEGPQTPVDPERLARVAADHDITILGPPGMLPADVVNV
jgi:mannose-6-phosphate isomerase-like protein (cupin superfamily)